MTPKKDFQRNLSRARSLAFDIMAMLDRIEAEFPKEDAYWGDVGTTAYFCERLDEMKSEIKPYVDTLLG